MMLSRAGGQLPPQMPNMHAVDIDAAPVAKCLNCNNESFSTASKFHYISPILTHDGKPGISQSQVLICTKCHTEFDIEIFVENQLSPNPSIII